jgi:hypothetical protein
MWIITKDFTDFTDENEGKTNNLYCTYTAVEIKSKGFDVSKPLTEHFLIYDDDGNLYYEGNSDDSESEAAFAPLDDYGMPNAGATEIRYNRNGVFESL